MQSLESEDIRNRVGPNSAKEFRETGLLSSIVERSEPSKKERLVYSTGPLRLEKTTEHAAVCSTVCCIVCCTVCTICQSCLHPFGAQDAFHVAIDVANDVPIVIWGESLDLKAHRSWIEFVFGLGLEAATLP